eukprot:COSAG05_NODE_1419_length_4930_cov_4.794866_5_plen_124_part_00
MQTTYNRNHGAGLTDIELELHFLVAISAHPAMLIAREGSGDAPNRIQCLGMHQRLRNLDIIKKHHTIRIRCRATLQCAAIHRRQVGGAVNADIEPIVGVELFAQHLFDVGQHCVIDLWATPPS